MYVETMYVCWLDGYTVYTRSIRTFNYNLILTKYLYLIFLYWSKLHLKQLTFVFL